MRLGTVLVAGLLSVAAVSPPFSFVDSYPELVRREDTEARWRAGQMGRLCSPDPAQDSLNVRRAGRALFEPLGIFYESNDTCYVMSGRDVVVYDLSDESSPKFLASHRTPVSGVVDVFSLGSYLYLTSLEEGFWILDKMNNYRVIGSYDPGVTLWWGFVENARAYLMSVTSLYIVDVSNPEAPQVLGGFSRASGVGRVSVRGVGSFSRSRRRWDSSMGIISCRVSKSQEIMHTFVITREEGLSTFWISARSRCRS
jgi:hypothetical protein